MPLYMQSKWTCIATVSSVLRHQAQKIQSLQSHRDLVSWLCLLSIPKPQVIILESVLCSHQRPSEREVRDSARKVSSLIAYLSCYTRPS